LHIERPDSHWSGERACKTAFQNDLLDPAAVKTAEKSLLTPRNERRMKELLEALCDPTRVKIVRALRETTLAAGDLAHVINRSRSATSQHLKVLRTSASLSPRATGTSSATTSPMK
jgi:hypothetical protein